MSYENLTVAQLRAEIKALATETGYELPGLSKLRKDELTALLSQLRSRRTAQAVDTAMQARTIDVPTVGTFEANSFLAAVGFALAAPMSAQDRHDLDMAKYRGRFEGKRVRVQVGEKYDKLSGESLPNIVTGNVVDGTHRAVDPLNRGEGKGTLVLTVKHDDVSRATLHRAEDVVLV